MSKESQVVVRRRDNVVEAQANATRALFGLRPNDSVNMAKLVDIILTKHFPAYVMEVEEDARMSGCEAFTDKKELRITFSRSTLEALLRGDPRARMTAAHEVGHLFLHCGRWWGTVTGRVNPLNDPEKQADIFAAAFLMPASAFRKMRSINEAMTAFGVSRNAAMCRARKLGLSDALRIYEPIQTRVHKKKGRKLMASTP